MPAPWPGDATEENLTTHDETHGPTNVDADTLRELTRRYGQYLQAVTAPTDPVKTLTLTRQILEAVYRVITAPDRGQVRP
jgi:hypothetical protein